VSLKTTTTLTLLLLLAACGDDASPVDAGAIPEVDGGAPDAGSAPSYLFGPCVSDAQCPGADGVCRGPEEGYPQGYCTRPCEDRTPCDDGVVYHHCVQGEDGESWCEQRCLNGADCGRSPYTCVGELPPSGGVCVAYCSEGDCGAGAECNPWSGQCGRAGSRPETGGVTGDPCAGAEDCRSGVCLTEETNGWPGGTCVGVCLLPAGFNTNNIWAEDALPRATCPDEDSVCFPEGSAQARGDPGLCLPACESADDCRSGYTCRLSFEISSGVRTFARSFCVPAG